MIEINTVGRICRKPESKTSYLFLDNLNNVFILKQMAETTVLRVVPCTYAPNQDILHFLNKAPMYVITEIFYSTATSILKS